MFFNRQKTDIALDAKPVQQIKVVQSDLSAYADVPRFSTVEEAKGEDPPIPVVIEDAGGVQQAMAEVWEEGAEETKRINEIRNLRKAHPSKPQIKKLCAYSFAGIADLDRVVAELPPKSKFHTVESTLVDGSYRGIMLKKVHGEWQLLVERYEQEAFKLAVQEQLHPKEVEPQPKHIVRSYGYVRQKVRPLAPHRPRQPQFTCEVEIVGGPLLDELIRSFQSYKEILESVKEAPSDERLVGMVSGLDSVIASFQELQAKNVRVATQS